jgi:hypothetical protein
MSDYCTACGITLAESDTLVYERVPSFTNPRTVYVVSVVNDRPISCTCPDWAWRMRREDVEAYVCKHMQQVWLTYPQTMGKPLHVVDLDTLPESGQSTFTAKWCRESDELLPD